MVGRGELTEEAWSVIAPLLPVSGGRRGGQWRDHRTVINGILWLRFVCSKTVKAGEEQQRETSLVDN
jgi:hypothetical protein